MPVESRSNRSLDLELGWPGCEPRHSHLSSSFRKRHRERVDLLQIVTNTAWRAREQRTSSGPSFLFIGAAKAGSNWFMEILWEHPEVFVPPNKGTRFFNRHYDKGPSWYEEFFSKGCRRYVSGEVCEDYLTDPEALARIKEYRPEMRLICCLRNPYERAISSWRFFVRNGLGKPTLAAQAARSPELFLNGYYHTQLEVVRSLFSPEQLLVLLYDGLLAAPEITARQV